MMINQGATEGLFGDKRSAMKFTPLLTAVGIASFLLLISVSPDTRIRAADPNQAKDAGSANEPTAAKGLPGPPSVSLVPIIADPERFHGKEVVVTGFVSIGRDLNTLWLSKESIEYKIVENAIIIDVSKCENRSAFFAEADGGCCGLRGVIDAHRLNEAIGRVVPVLVMTKFLWRQVRY